MGNASNALGMERLLFLYFSYFFQANPVTLRVVTVRT